MPAPDIELLNSSSMQLSESSTVLPSNFDLKNCIVLRQPFGKLARAIDGLTVEFLTAETDPNYCQFLPDGVAFAKGWVGRTLIDPQDNNVHLTYAITLDAPLAFLLKHDRYPLAVASWYPGTQQSINVCQLQGVNGYPSDSCGRPLEDRKSTAFKWFFGSTDVHRTILRISSELSRELGYRVIRCPRAERIRWGEPLADEEIPHMTKDRLTTIYGRTPHDEGFILNGDYWEKNLLSRG